MFLTMKAVPCYMRQQFGYREIAELLLGSSASLEAQNEMQETLLNLVPLTILALTLHVVALTALTLTLHIVALTAPALTPCVVALAARPHTTPAALASLTGGHRCIQHLMYRPWDAITLFFVLYHPIVPPPSTYEQPAFCDILAIILHHLAASPRDLQSIVQHHMHAW
jgi:hypothetical protein